MSDRRGKKPKVRIEELPATTVDDGKRLTHPKISLRYLIPGFDIKQDGLTEKLKSDLAERLQEICGLDWSTILQTRKHGQGTETLPVARLKVSLPRKFCDETKVLVFRYSGRLPLIGVRVEDTLHVLAISPRFGDLYDHSLHAH